MTLHHALADLFVGAACPGCHVPHLGVCPRCRDLVSSPRLVRRFVLGADRLLAVVALNQYRDEVAQMLRALKDGGSWSVAGSCGPGLAAAATLFDLDDPLLVPVPSSVAALRRRGHDHAGALARAASRCGAGTTRHVFANRRGIEDQVGLGVTERERNQRGSLHTRVGQLAVPRPVLLVDDICTTGATLVESATTLQRAGWQVRGAIVVAETPRRHARHTPTGEIQMTGR